MAAREIADRPPDGFFFKKADGTIVSRDYYVPGGDGARFLGFLALTEEERQRIQKKISGGRVIELTLRRAFQELYESARVRGQLYWDPIINLVLAQSVPGRQRTMLTNGLHSLQQTVDTLGDSPKGVHTRLSGSAPYIDRLMQFHRDTTEGAYRYLEMQFKWLWLTKSYDTTSNLMKVRHEAVMKTIRGEP